MSPVLFRHECEGHPEIAIVTGEVEMQGLGLARPAFARSLPAELGQCRGIEAAHCGFCDLAPRARLDDAALGFVEDDVAVLDRREIPHQRYVLGAGHELLRAG